MTVVDKGVKDDDNGAFWQNLLFTAMGAGVAGIGAEISRRRSKKAARRDNLQHKISAIDDLMTTSSALAPKMVPFAQSASEADVLALTSAIATVRAASKRVDDEELDKLTNNFLDKATEVINLRLNPTAAQQQVLRAAREMDELEQRADELREGLRTKIKKAA